MTLRYERMLKAMTLKEKSQGMKREKWFLYILECSDGKFYTGITKDIEQRLKRHNDGKAASFTRVRRPVKLIYREILSSRTQALIREHAIKTLSRKDKEKLIDS